MDSILFCYGLPGDFNATLDFPLGAWSLLDAVANGDGGDRR